MRPTASRHVLQLAAAAAAVLTVFAAADAHAAKSRGAANTSERAEWCSERLGNCLSTADETCNFTYGGNAQQLGACQEERRGQCNRSYGSGSKCRSAARAGAAGAVQPGSKAISK